MDAHINALMLSQQKDKAKEKILYALGITEKLGCKWKLPELLRLKAVCILGQGNFDTSEVEAILFESLNLARKQKAKLWELRTAISLARLWGEGQERQKAYDLLLPIYNWYTEGFGTADLRDAKGLLEQLQ